jgi:sugar phosphate isomerase/epimerase
MKKNVQRRNFLKSALTIPALAKSNFLFSAPVNGKNSTHSITPAHKLKISLNAFSFNVPLTNGSMNLDDLLEFCSGTIIQAVDLTGYYFSGYPAVPSDEYIYHIKQKAFHLGLDISGTGVRNDFTDPDEKKRREHITLVKNWIECASKLGAPVIRLFAGTQNPQGYTWNQVATWMMKDVQECIDYGKKHGVIVGIQNHNDFIKTASDVQKIMKMHSSEWFGLILDTGSYQTGDPYQQIADTARYAVNWQLKENVFINGVETPADLDKIITAIKASGYKGYLPIETLGAGNPKIKVPAFLEKVQKALL